MKADDLGFGYLPQAAKDFIETGAPGTTKSAPNGTWT